MQPIPLPSHVHYELILQLLERKSLSAINEEPMIRERIQQLTVTLRKALAQQKQLEAICEQKRVTYEYRWSLNSIDATSASPSDGLTIQSPPH